MKIKLVRSMFYDTMEFIFNDKIIFLIPKYYATLISGQTKY